MEDRLEVLPNAARPVNTDAAAIKDRMAMDEPRLSLPTPGPRTGGDPMAYLVQAATPDELRELAEIIRKRRAADTAVWMECDGCHFIGKFRGEHAGRSCALCNSMSQRAGGHLQTMTPAAVEQYKLVKGERDRATDARMRAAARAARDAERGKAGLAKLTDDEWAAEQRAAGEAMRRQQATLMASAAQYHREQGEK